MMMMMMMVVVVVVVVWCELVGWCLRTVFDTFIANRLYRAKTYEIFTVQHRLRIHYLDV